MLSAYHFLCSVYQKLLMEAKRKLGEILSAFEFLDNHAMDLVSFLWHIRTLLPVCASYSYKIPSFDFHILTRLRLLKKSLPDLLRYNPTYCMKSLLIFILSPLASYLLDHICQVLHHLDGVRNPLPASMHNFYVLIETTGSNESYDR